MNSDKINSSFQPGQAQVFKTELIEEIDNPDSTTETSPQADLYNHNDNTEGFHMPGMNISDVNEALKVWFKPL